MRVIHRGNWQLGNRPPKKSDHGGAALENALADVLRSMARLSGGDTEYAAREGFPWSGTCKEAHGRLSTAERGEGMYKAGKPDFANLTLPPCS